MARRIGKRYQPACEHCGIPPWLECHCSASLPQDETPTDIELEPWQQQHLLEVLADADSN